MVQYVKCGFAGDTVPHSFPCMIGTPLQQSGPSGESAHVSLPCTASSSTLLHLQPVSAAANRLRLENNKVALNFEDGDDFLDLGSPPAGKDAAEVTSAAPKLAGDR